MPGEAAVPGSQEARAVRRWKGLGEAEYHGGRNKWWAPQLPGSRKRDGKGRVPISPSKACPQ